MNSLAAIHVGKRELGLDEETYRGLLVRVTGKSSAKDMSEGKRSRVLAEMQRVGFKPASRGFQKDRKTGFNGDGKGQEARSGEATTGKARKARSDLYRKLQALWIAG